MVARKIRDIKGMQFKKEEIKLSRFADNEISYIKISNLQKQKQKTLLDLKSEFGKVIWHKSTQKLSIYILTINSGNQTKKCNTFYKENEILRYKSDKTDTRSS